MRKYIGYMLSVIMLVSFMAMDLYGKATSFESKYGFERLIESYEQAIGSNVIIYNHKVTGARVVYVQNEDPNKVFALGFKTPIYDDTGVNHIIEHTVFTGSRKYDTKDVFFEMNKRSPNIYMNASTSVDMTVYPFSTRNHKDYENLLDIYLDAVFFPKLQEEPYGFYQEGFHYYVDQDGNMNISGVVYNEMKGASVIPRRILAMTNRAVMYPDTMYAHSSGGDPGSIWKLSYEDLKKTHKEYYTPSNSCAFVYGDVSIKEILKKLNDYYLAFPVTQEQNISQKQDLFTEKKYHMDYFPSSSLADGCMISLNYVVGDIEDIKLQLSMEILMNILVKHEDSPLKNVLNKKQLSKMLYVDVDSAIPQPMYSIIITDVKKENVETITSLIQETLEKTAQMGINDDIIKMVMNGYEISEKQKNSSVSKGRDLAYDVIYSWGHNVPLMNVFQKSDIIKQIKQEGDSQYFQNLIQECMISNNHTSQVVLEPDQDYILKQQLKEKQYIEELTLQIRSEDRQKIVDNQEKLKKWQETREDLLSLPQLAIEDIDTSGELPQLIIKNKKNRKNLYYITDTDGLVYLNLYFDTSHIPQESLNELFLLSHIITQLEKEDMFLYTSGLNCEVLAIPRVDQYTQYDPKLKLSVCMKQEDIPKTFEILSNITSDITIWESQWILTQVRKIRSQYEHYFHSKPLEVISVAINNSQEGAGRYEYQQLIPFYQYICQIEEDFEKHQEQIMKKLNIIKSSVFNKNEVVLGATAEEDSIKKLESSYKKYYKNLNDIHYPNTSYHFDTKCKKQGFPIAADVQYIVSGGNYKQAGGLYEGALYVLNNILNTDYMLQNLRVKSGAYGAGMTFNPFGNINFYSYQDPQLENSLEIISNIPQYIKKFDKDPDEMIHYKIGALSKLEQSLGLNDHPKVVGTTLEEYYLSGINHDYIEKIKEQILFTTASDIRSLSSLLKKVIQEKRYSVAGNKNRLLTSKKYFDIIQSFSSI